MMTSPDGDLRTVGVHVKRQQLPFFPTFVLWALLNHSAINPGVCNAHISDDLLNIYSKTYSTRHGLLSNAVSSITQDQQGRIWICTQRGVSSYNGHEFLSYQPENHQDISTFYQSIMFDSRKNAWIATTNGIATISNGTVIPVSLEWGLGAPSVQDIREDAQGRIWALCNSREILRVDDHSLAKPVWENEPEQVVITRLRSSPDGRIWMSTSTGFYILDNGIIQSFPAFSKYTVLDFCLDGNQSGWMIDSEGKLYQFDDKQFRAAGELPAAAARTVYDMAVTQSGSLWIATFRGLFLYDGDRLSSFDYRNGIASNVIRSIFIDREGCLWYASDNGLGKISGLMFRRIMPTQDLPVSSVTGLCDDAKGNIWIAANDGLIRLDKHKIRIWRNEDGLIGDSVHSVAEYKDGVAFTTPFGLFRIDSSEKIQPLIRDQTVEFLNLLPENNSIWLVSDDGLFRYIESGKLEDLTDLLPMKNNSPVSAVFRDHGGNLWIATDGDGLFVRGKETPDTFVSVQGLPSMRVFSIAEDESGSIWVGTLAGFCSIKHNSVQNVFSSKHGLMSEDIWTVMVDRENTIWVATGRGLSSISEDQVQNFDYEDGLSGEDFVSNCRYIDDQGRLWFGGLGITVVDPSEKMPIVKPLTYLRYARLNNEPLKNNAVVPAGKNTFEFGFSCSSFRNELQNRYRYQLLGFDAFRQPVTTVSNVRYTNLPKGQYSFIVQSSNRDGQWSDTPASISFEVLPAWYEQKLVWALGLCILLLGIRLYIRWRSFKLAKLNIWLQNEVKRQTSVIQQQLYRLEEQKSQLEYQAITDELTQLYNRRYFYQKLQSAWNASKERKTPVAVIIFDLDHFKEINDAFGHLTGDRALSAVSQLIPKLLPREAVVARFGGEEFIVLLEDASLQDAKEIGEVVREGIEGIVFQDNLLCGHSVTVSGGVASIDVSNNELSPDLLVKAADDALYQAKLAGRNRIVASEIH